MGNSNLKIDIYALPVLVGNRYGNGEKIASLCVASTKPFSVATCLLVFLRHHSSGQPTRATQPRTHEPVYSQACDHHGRVLPSARLVAEHTHSIRMYWKILRQPNVSRSDNIVSSLLDEKIQNTVSYAISVI